MVGRRKKIELWFNTGVYSGLMHSGIRKVRESNKSLPVFFGAEGECVWYMKSQGFLKVDFEPEYYSEVHRRA